MLALARGVSDVAITITVVAASAAIIFGVDRFPPTRWLLDKIDPSRTWNRQHPTPTRATATGTVTLIPRELDPVAELWNEDARPLDTDVDA